MSARESEKTGGQAPVEIELTLRLEPKSASRLIHDPLLAKLKQGPRKTRRLVTTYFDTSDFRLQRQRAALRVRQIGDRRIQTVKLAPMPEDGVLARREWERDIDGNAPDLRDIDDRHVRRILRGDDVKDKLEPIFVAEITRSTIPVKLDGSDIEVAVDVGEIKTESGSVPVCEAELELKSGNVGSVYKLAQELTKRIPLAVESMSKAERGYALAANKKPTPRRADSVRLDKNMTAGEAFRLVVRSCLLHLRANEASVRAAAGSDGIHQLRVAVRRLRSAFSAFDSIIPADEKRRIGDSVRWIAQRCGRARELDVFLSDIVRPLTNRLPNDSALHDFGVLAESARKDAYAQVRAAIDSPEYTDTLLTLEAWIEGETWRAAESDHTLSVQAFARERLKRLHRKLVKNGARLDKLDEDGLHALRLRAKKLRYTAEFFRSLFGGKTTRSYLDALTAIQDRLGSLNDGVVVRELVEAIERDNADIDRSAYAHAVGLVLGWNACRVTVDLKRLPAVWEKFRATKPPWK